MKCISMLCAATSAGGVSTKPVIPQQLAHRDVEEACAYSVREAGELVVLGWIDAIEAAYAHLGRHPRTGSPRYGRDLNLSGLLIWLVTRYPYLIFFVERDDRVDIWRVLHGQRNIPAWLGLLSAGL